MGFVIKAGVKVNDLEESQLTRHNLKTHPRLQHRIVFCEKKENTVNRAKHAVMRDMAVETGWKSKRRDFTVLT